MMKLICRNCGHEKDGHYVIGSGVIRCPKCKEKTITIVDQFGSSFHQDDWDLQPDEPDDEGDYWDTFPDHQYQ